MLAQRANRQLLGTCRGCSASRRHRGTPLLSCARLIGAISSTQVHAMETLKGAVDSVKQATGLGASQVDKAQ
jgi:hypothetical protein